MILRTVGKPCYKDRDAPKTTRILFICYQFYLLSNKHKSLYKSSLVGPVLNYKEVLKIMDEELRKPEASNTVLQGPVHDCRHFQILSCRSSAKCQVSQISNPATCGKVIGMSHHSLWRATR